ncbi:DUF6086 family protein [Kutzneria kofuensis]|uniref:Uncharacterized protein n=1 Tax=Kutzneria kofuensis TaxID=103725 RepID=A0A7W9NG51_9PSEU|nr:DUF6086 family protein [Kutzneria kofuensis]MBB5890738.1 hypothetical protein [Kutzneria kofuensis]
MSVSFQLRDAPDNLWNPASGVGRTYLGVARLIEAENPEFPALDTWLSVWTSDDYWIDPAGLAGWLRVVLDSSVVGHTQYLRLTRGFLEISLGMLFRAGGDIEAANSDQAELIAVGRELARTLVR